MARKQSTSADPGATADGSSDRAAPLDVPTEALGIQVPNLGVEIPSEALPSLADLEATTDVPGDGAEPAPAEEVKPRRKHRRTRPAPGTEVQAGPAPVTDQEIEDMGKVLGLGFRVLSRMVASKRGEHWALTPGEELELGLAWSKAAAPYFHLAGKYIPFATAAVATVGVLAPRLEIDAQRAAMLGPRIVRNPVPTPPQPPQPTTATSGEPTPFPVPGT